MIEKKLAENKLGVLFGPNLNLLGSRQPEIYGPETLNDHIKLAVDVAASAGFSVDSFQSNHEGELVDYIHQNRDQWAGIMINAGALTHYGWSLHDALAAFEGPVVESHISNPNSREPWRHISVVAPVATGSITGFGGNSSRLAVEAIIEVLRGKG